MGKKVVDDGAVGLGCSRTRTLEVENPHNPQVPVKRQPCVYLDAEGAGCGEAPKEDYWDLREREVLLGQQEVDRILGAEYDKARAEVKDLFRKYVGERGAGLPCADRGRAMVQCLKLNSGRPLECNGLLRAFSSCVDQRRVDKIRTEAVAT